MGRCTAQEAVHFPKRVPATRSTALQRSAKLALVTGTPEAGWRESSLVEMFGGIGGMNTRNWRGTRSGVRENKTYHFTPIPIFRGEFYRPFFFSNMYGCKKETIFAVNFSPCVRKAS